ncbi:MAG: hypothetical protein J6H18_02965 [Lachnospiraceae bacterium]|nr:hypothetical protein [Lachnospiraceae bacterium]
MEKMEMRPAEETETENTAQAELKEIAEMPSDIEKTVAVEIPGNGEKKRKEKRRKHRKIHEITPENDIKYRGPLSYRHFKILGWLCIVASQILVLVKLGARIDAQYAARAATPTMILSILGNLALPLLLFSNYAIILNARDSYKKLLLRYAAIIAGFFAVFWVAYNRYLKGITAILSENTLVPEDILGNLTGGWAGFFAFNIFVDLFLCTLYMFFLNYEPKKIFRGKALILFRMMAILPILYEVFSILLKLWAGQKKIFLPTWTYPLLTTKPPLSFLMFTIVGLVLKKRERRYLKKGGSREGYRDFLETNSNSWHFSVYTSIIVFITGILDLIVFILISVFLSDPVRLASASPAEVEAMLDASFLLVDHMGFGQAAGMLLIIPLLLLFSYNRKYKNTQIDMLIPFGGIVMIFVVYLEGIYQLLQMLALPASGLMP